MGWLLLLALLALLAVPIELIFNIEHRDGWRASTQLRWLFGLVRVGIKRGRPRPARARERERPSKTRPSRTKARKLLFDPDAWRHAGRLFARLWRTLRPRDLRLHACIGFDDPADTGRFWAGFGPALALLIPGQANVRVSPAFKEEILELHGSGRIRIVLPRILAILVAFGFSPTTWRLLWKLWFA